MSGTPTPKYIVTSEREAHIDRSFVYHAPKDDQVERYAFIRANFKALATMLCEQCPNSPELGVSLTLLQQSMMMANAAIACNE